MLEESNQIKITDIITAILVITLFISTIPILIQLKPKEIKEERYLFLGDSITEYYKLNNYYGDKIVFNSGISGDRTHNILNNLNERVFKYKPTTIFLLIGTNDLLESTNEEIVSNILKICDNIYLKDQNIRIYVESIYPISKEKNNKISSSMVNKRDNTRIKQINKLLLKASKQYHYNYIDLYNLLVDDNDNIKLDYTSDGLHLSDEGYQVVTNKILKIMNE